MCSKKKLKNNGSEKAPVVNDKNKKAEVKVGEVGVKGEAM